MAGGRRHANVICKHESFNPSTDTKLAIKLLNTTSYRYWRRKLKKSCKSSLVIQPECNKLSSSKLGENLLNRNYTNEVPKLTSIIPVVNSSLFTCSRELTQIYACAIGVCSERSKKAFQFYNPSWFVNPEKKPINMRKYRSPASY